MSFELRRTRWVGASGAVLLGFFAVVALLPAPYVALSPGPTFNTIGTIDGKPLIQISGRPTYPTAGNLDMTTVSERGGPYGPMYVGKVLQGWRDPSVRVLPVEALFPQDVPAAQVEAENQADFVDSQSEAAAAALRHLQIPVIEQVAVAQVAPGSPAAGILQVGDVLISVGGTAITTPATVATVVRSSPPGRVVPVVIERGGASLTVRITTGPAPTDPTKAYLGISVTTHYRAPFPITFTLDQVGGPSAGMMFSLALVDMLTPGELNGGRHIAGTGTIDAAGVVGPIGGIAQKLVGARDGGATLFLAPRSNCGEVTGNIPDGLTVTPVSTLDDAVAALADYTAGRATPTCP